jgi:hypothetical protein
MDEVSPTMQEWRQLYTLMDRLKELAPWEWMDEMDLFGIQNPETGEVGFVSVMGALGEHYAVAVYLGEQGLAGFWNMQQAGPYLTPDLVLNTPQLQASFEDRNTLHQKDRDVIKQLGLKYRGKQAWPQFQSYAPGMVPWYLSAAEARFLAHAVEQTLDVAARLKSDPTLLAVRADDEDVYMVRVPTQKDGAWVWHDQWQPAPQPENRPVPVYMDRKALALLESLPPTMGRIDLDFSWMPVPVLGKLPRPYYPYNLLIVEPASGMILGNDTMLSEPAFDEMWGNMPVKVAQMLARLRLRPGIIRVRSESVAQFIEPLADHLHIKIERVDELPELENIQEMLTSFLMR